MKRPLLAFWDGQEVEVHRPTGQVFRFPAHQAEAGGHQVFAVGDGRPGRGLDFHRAKRIPAGHSPGALHPNGNVPG